MHNSVIPFINFVVYLTIGVFLVVYANKTPNAIVSATDSDPSHIACLSLSDLSCLDCINSATPEENTVLKCSSACFGVSAACKQCKRNPMPGKDCASVCRNNSPSPSGRGSNLRQASKKNNQNVQNLKMTAQISGGVLLFMSLLSLIHMLVNLNRSHS